MASENLGYQRLRGFFWGAAVTLGALDAWATRHAMNPDGVSYLDIGDAYWRGDWHMAINAYWSPLYSWLLGLALKILKPSAYWEYPVVHMVNFVIYLAALASFEFFLRTLIAGGRQSGTSAGQEAVVILPDWAWWTLGYSLFIWTSLVMMGMRNVTPDMCVAASVYLASGLILRVRSGTATRRTFVVLGIVLGLGYLAKAVMFPLALVFLAVVMLSYGSIAKAIPRVMISALAFLAVAGPFILALSLAKGRLTWGDAGKLNYAGCLNGVDAWYPGDSGRAACGGSGVVEGLDAWFPANLALRHPAQRIFDVPATYQFAGPIGGTDPYWYDPSYWQEGVKPVFYLMGHVKAIGDSLVSYGLLLFYPSMQLNVAVGLLILVLGSTQASLFLKKAAAEWPLLVVALSALGLYSIIMTEFRYIAPFVCLLWMAAFSGVSLPASRASKRMVAGVVIAVAATSGLSATLWTFRKINAKNADPVYWKAARALDEKGVHPGDRIALIADRPLGEGGPFVARLAKVQIIAQVNRPDRFWAASPSTQEQVREAMARTGAKAILAWQPPRSGLDAAWQQLGGTRYYVNLLDSGVR